MKCTDQYGICGQAPLWPVHISRWNGTFDRAFGIKWTEITKFKKFPSTTMRCLAVSCEPFQKRVIGRFGDGRFFPPIKCKKFKVEYSFFLKRQVSKTLFPNFNCECTSSEWPSNRRCGGRTHVLDS